MTMNEASCWTPARALALLLAALLLGFGLGLVPAAAAADAETVPEPVAPADCAEACRQRVAGWLERCLAAGGEECEAKAERHLTSCLAACDNPRAAPPSCETACAERARTWHERCVARGGEDCGAEARKLQAKCRESCPPRQAQPQPRPVDCETACAERARTWHERCVARGGEDCGAEARKLHGRCRESCPPRATPIDCQSACRVRAAVWLVRCAADGGRAQCAQRARGLLAQCLTTCDRGASLEPQPPRQLVPSQP